MNLTSYLGNLKSKFLVGFRCFILVFILCQLHIYTKAQTAYWLESLNNKVRKISVSNPPVSAVNATNITSAHVPVFIFADKRNNFIYWSDNGAGAILRVSTSGGVIDTVVKNISGAGIYLKGLYLDITNNLLYWSQTGIGKTDSIKKINISGSLPKLGTNGSPVVTAIAIVRGITVDTISNQIYYVNADTGSRRGIYRASLTAPIGDSLATKIAATPVIVSATPQPNALFLDRANNFIYWCDYANPNGKIQRAPTNAGSYPAIPADVFTGQSIRGISIDAINNTIYWLEPLNLKIKKASLSSIPVTASNADTNLTVFPRDLAIITLLSGTTDYYRTRQSGNWNDVNTWESSPVADFSLGLTSPATQVPDTTANTIKILDSHIVTVTANTKIDQTIINTGGAVTINNGDTLSVYDGAGFDITVNGILTLQSGGNITIKSTANGTASIGTSSGTFSGNVTIERYFSNRRAWRLLGIPFSTSSQTIKTAWMEGAANVSANPSPGYGTQITTFTGDANAANFDAVKPASSIRTYSADNFNSDAAHTPNTNNFIVGSQSQAYFLFVRGDRAADRTATATSSATTLRATGAIKVGNVTGIGATGTGFSLIQNPYPSAINFDSIKAIAANTSISRFYVWDATVGTTGQYRTIDITGSAPAYTYTATPGSQNNNYKFIESGTAFFIEGNRQINFTEAVKSAGIPPSSVLRTSPSQQAELGININTVNADNTLSLTDGVREVFDNNYLAAVDNNDAKKIEGFNLNLGIAKGNEVLAIEKRPLPNINDVIALKLWNTVPGNYQFEIDPANIASQIPAAYLYDSYLNSYTSLDLKATTTNSFTITSDAASAGANRFSIVFSKPGMVNTKPAIVIYPNPAQNGVIKLQMNNMPKGNYFIKLLNNLGQTILSKQINHAEGTSTETITVNKITGVYMLEVVKPNNTKSSNKLIIN